MVDKTPKLGDDPDKEAEALEKAAKAAAGPGDASPEKDETTPDLEPVPCVFVLGHTTTGDNVAVSLAWKRGMTTVSNSRLKFMREELSMNIIDDPAKYLF